MNGARSCDLLISDYAMPQISGTEFVRRRARSVPMCPR